VKCVRLPSVGVPTVASRFSTVTLSWCDGVEVV